MTAPSIFARTKAELQRRGWRQGPTTIDEIQAVADSDEPCCLVVALEAATDTEDEYDEAWQKMHRFTGTSLSRWNDVPGRTEREVFDLLDAMDLG